MEKRKKELKRLLKKGFKKGLDGKELEKIVKTQGSLLKEAVGYALPKEDEKISDFFSYLFDKGLLNKLLEEQIFPIPILFLEDRAKAFSKFSESIKRAADLFRKRDVEEILKLDPYILLCIEFQALVNGDVDIFKEILKNASKELKFHICELISLVPKKEFEEVLKETIPHLEISKDLKKLIYILKTKGIDIEDSLLVKEKSILGMVIEKDEEKAYISRTFPDGSRMIWLSTKKGRIYYGFRGILNEDEGIVDFEALRVKKKDFKRIMEDIEKQSRLLFEVPSWYVKNLLLIFDKIGEKNREFSSWKTFIIKDEDAKRDPSVHPIYELFDISWVSESDYLYEEANYKLSEMFEWDHIKDWKIKTEQEDALLKAIEEVEKSPILIPEYQKKGRLYEIYADFANRIFDKDKRFFYKKRLEDEALFYAKGGDKQKCYLLLRIASEVGKTDKEPKDIKFLVEIVRRSVETKKETEEGLIVKPSSF